MGEKRGVKMSDYDMFELEKQIIQLELERSRLNREKSMVILNKSVFLYFTFMFIGVVGFVNSYISSGLLNFFVVMGLVALIVGAMPYILAAQTEQKKLSSILDSLLLRASNSNNINTKTTQRDKQVRK